MKVLDYLLDLTIDISIIDISEGTDLTRKTIDKIMDNFLEEGIVFKTRKVGKTQMFKLNISNLVVEKLYEINKLVLTGQEDKLQTHLESPA